MSNGTNPSPWPAAIGGALERLSATLMEIMAQKKEHAFRTSEQARLREEASANRAMLQQQIDQTLAGQKYQQARDVIENAPPESELPPEAVDFLKRFAPGLAASRIREIPVLPRANQPIAGYTGTGTSDTLPAIPQAQSALDRVTAIVAPNWQQTQELNRQSKVRAAVEALGPKYGPLAEAFGGQIPTSPAEELANRLAVGRQAGEYELTGRRITGQYGLQEAAARRKAEAEMTAKQERAAFAGSWQRAYSAAAKEASDVMKVTDTLAGRSNWLISHPGEPMPARPSGASIRNRAIEIVKQDPSLFGIDVDKYLPQTSAPQTPARQDPLGLNTPSAPPRFSTLPSTHAGNPAVNTVLRNLGK
jgi:hypothetical protein